MRSRIASKEESVSILLPQQSACLRLSSLHPVLVTGPSPNGIGDATARGLARGHPAALLLVGRNPAKYAPVVDAIHAIDSSISVSVYGIDLGSFASVRSGAQKILIENERIDVLINSAGTAGMPLTYTSDGIEETFATNYVGHFFLTNLLMPALKRSEERRVVNVTSVAAFAASGGKQTIPFARDQSELSSFPSASRLHGFQLQE